MRLNALQYRECAHCSHWSRIRFVRKEERKLFSYSTFLLDSGSKCFRIGEKTDSIMQFQILVFLVATFHSVLSPFVIFFVHGHFNCQKHCATIRLQKIENQFRFEQIRRVVFISNLILSPTECKIPICPLQNAVLSEFV